MDERISSRAVGTNYEILARNYLERVGLVFVAANVTLRCGEIDLIIEIKKKNISNVFLSSRK